MGDEQYREAQAIFELNDLGQDARCTTTSSAVVGSSMMMISGSAASAMAIITRWRMPPDSSWTDRKSVV